MNCQGSALHIASRTLFLKEKVLETEYFDNDGGIDKKKIVQSKRRNQNATVNDDDDLIDHETLINSEKEIVTAVRNLHQETLDHVRTRKRDEDTLRNDMSREIDNNPVTSRPKTPLVKMKNDAVQMKIDYLSPYLSFVQNINEISKEEAILIRDSCTTTMKERLMERANIIQNRLNEEHERLTQCQTSYQHKLQTDSQSEEAFEKLCGEIAFKIKILERRLQEHEDASLDKVKALESKLVNDPRLHTISL